MIEETRIIHEQTGEVKSRRVRHIAAAFDEERGYLFWARKSFAKSFLDVPFPAELSHAEIGKLAILSKHIWSNTNMLGRRARGGARPYSVPEIGEIIGLREYQARAYVRKMIRLGVMARVEVVIGDEDGDKRREVQYYLNPIYFFSSNRIPLNLYLIFRQQLDRVLPDWVKQEFCKQSTRQGAGK